MTRSYKPADFSRLQTYSATRRAHKTSVAGAAGLPDAGASASDLIDSLPRFLGADAFRRVVDAVAAAANAERPVVLAFGAHVLKVGCGPIVVDLIRRGVVSAIACNGACAIHDVELATLGQTSEEVADTIRDGSFGMVAETIGFFDDVVRRAKKDSTGLGAAVGRLLIEREPPNRAQSVFAAASEAGIPACVHVAIGTDTVHASGGLDGAALGEASMHDFRLICDVVSDLGAKERGGAGGVWMNVGSAVILPEVFLKAVAVARNLGADLDAMTTANFDMKPHYRPTQNVVLRPVAAGRGFQVLGHHEILLPLFRQAVIEKIAAATRSA